MMQSDAGFRNSEYTFVKNHPARYVSAIAVALLLLNVCPANAQAAPDFAATGQPISAAPADPAIRQALGQVSPRQIRRTIETLVSFGNRNTLSSMETSLPQGTGVSAAADWLQKELQQYSADCGGCLEVKLDTFTETPQSRIPKPTTITNVYAVLRGTDPKQAKQIYLVTGHYDSRVVDVLNTKSPAPGANDDASGTAVSLECARVLSRSKFRSTLIFAMVAGEEQGLNGSRHLAKLAKSEGWQILGVFNNDIVGGDTTPGNAKQQKSMVRVFSEGIPATTTPEQLQAIQSLGAENDSPSRELARATVDAGKTYFRAPGHSGTGQGQAASFTPVMQYRRDRFLRGGDQVPFNQEGFAAVRITEWMENYNHQHQDVRTENGVEYGDLTKFIDFDYVANVVKLNAATMATLASAPAPPEDVKIETKKLDNNTTLTWKDGPGAAAKTYQIVWRETSAPNWQRSVDTHGERKATLPVSKDNVIFGVRAVDDAGHRSLVVTPTPER